MTFGVRVYNESGYLQIGDHIKTYTLLASGYAAIDAYGRWECSFPDTGYQPILMVRWQSTSTWVMVNAYRTGARGRILNNEGTGWIGGGTIQWAVFRKDPVYSSTFGVRLFNETELTLDSGNKQLRVHASIEHHPYRGTQSMPRTIYYSPGIHNPWIQVTNIHPYYYDLGSFYMVMRSHSAGVFQSAAVYWMDDTSGYALTHTYNFFDGLGYPAGKVFDQQYDSYIALSGGVY